MDDPGTEGTTDWDTRLREGFTALADRAPHDPDLARTVRRLGGGRSRRGPVLLAAASVAVAIGAVVVAHAIAGPDASPDPASTVGDESSYSCPAETPVAVVPAWARTGFSDPEPTMPYVLGDEGRIVAIVFGDPLTAPESADHGNKVLWVAKAGSGALTVDARLHPDDDPTVVELAGPGPSYLNLPTPGCWHLDLSWADQTDTMNIRVQAP